MNSREKVTIALNHKEPDKVPLELNGSCNSALTREAYIRLRNYLGWQEDKNIDVSWITTGTVRAKEDILKKYEIDTRSVFLKSSTKKVTNFLPDGSFYDDFGARWRPASYYYDVIERPLANIVSENDLQYAKWDDPNDETRIIGIREHAKDLFENTEFCLVGDFHTLGPFEGGCYLRGFENFLSDFYLNKNLAIALLEKLTDYCMEKWNIFLKEIGSYVQVVCQGDDLGTQNSLFVSPEIYRKFIKPLHKRIYDFIHSKTKAKVLMHSCGSIYDLIPDFIEIGVDVLNPVQRSAAKMDIKKLKGEFGNEISFWGGGIDIQTQLPFYSLKEIEQEVKRTIEIMASGGGFVFFPSHNIQPDVTPDRIDCMFRSVLKYRDYK